MNYHFDKITDRRNTNSLKWNIREQELPLWVADMDFPTAPCVLKAVRERAEKGIFGYEIVPGEWYEAYQGWWKSRHMFYLEKEWLVFCTGVVPAVTCAVKRMTNVGDQVLVQTPVYDIFFHSIENHGRHVVESPLVYQDGTYSIDFLELEQKLSHPLTTMMILCNPHNPIGKIWSAEELKEIGRLCKKHHVLVLSDEIHCDITSPGRNYIPFAAVSEECAENSITCLSASKAFNLAGLQSAAVMIPNEYLRQKMERGLNADELAEPNSFAVAATVAAFQKGADWLEELREYLWENRTFAEAYLESCQLPVSIASEDATYLLWMDCQHMIGDGGELCRFLRETTGLVLSAGSQYRGRNGGQFVRMNIACPRGILKEALERFCKGIYSFLETNL